MAIDGPGKTGRVFLDSLVAIAAIVISVASLWVALREGRTQERLLSASVWPYLQYGSADILPATNTDEIDFSLQNAGVGPARIQWIAFYYNGKAYAYGNDILAACCGGHHVATMITEGLDRRVLTAGQNVPFLHLTKKGTDAAVYAKLHRQRQTAFYLRSCYCSVLDECWLLDSRKPEPAPVVNCPPAEKPEWSG